MEKVLTIEQLERVGELERQQEGDFFSIKNITYAVFDTLLYNTRVTFCTKKKKNKSWWARKLNKIIVEANF